MRGVTKDSEYIELKEEVIALIQIQNNYIIAMYTITVSILAFAIERNNEWLFLLPYIILFSFQRIIMAKNDNMVRIAAYIVVFLEEGYGWESLYKSIVHYTTIKNNTSKPFSKLKNIVSGRISSLQLGLLSSTGCITVNIVNNKLYSMPIHDIKFFDIIPSLMGIILFVLLVSWCKNALNSMNRREVYIEALKFNKESINE